ncbi:hypothetical protein KQX54_000545 [Cotesia glomerata]|uniref:Uncharacterized protein n=1 Tax=Cotesia glomerata TaxID=32391 RepID=A0AAV7HS43_COTGL|nr:hypothetical protein KQX54_000545 [Cotesia glomerata]
MPELKISCNCEAYCLTSSMSIPKDFHTIYEIMENCFEGLREDIDMASDIEKSLDTIMTPNNYSNNYKDILESLNKCLKRKALFMYVIALIFKYEKCSYISEAMDKNTALGAKYVSLKARHPDLVARALSCSVEDLKKEFMEYY